MVVLLVFVFCGKLEVVEDVVAFDAVVQDGSARGCCCCCCVVVEVAAVILCWL